MKEVNGKVKPPVAVEKTDSVFRLKADTRHADDLALLAQGNVKVDDLAGVVGRLLARIKELEERK